VSSSALAPVTVNSEAVSSSVRWTDRRYYSSRQSASAERATGARARSVRSSSTATTASVASTRLVFAGVDSAGDRAGERAERITVSRSSMARSRFVRIVRTPYSIPLYVSGNAA